MQLSLFTASHTHQRETGTAIGTPDSPGGALSNVHRPMPIWKSALRKLGNKKAPDCSGALMKTN